MHLSEWSCIVLFYLNLGLYRIQVSQIRPEPDLYCRIRPEPDLAGAGCSLIYYMICAMFQLATDTSTALSLR